MARVHVWQYLLNEEGQPIPGADVQVLLASTTISAAIYSDERGGTPNYTGQLKTISNGFFEFWVADDSETGGYELDQKFKLTWNKAGVSSGFIDYFEVFNEPKGYAPVNVNDHNVTFNKLVSNQLANKWDSHVDADYTSVHSLLGLDPTDTGATKNRLLSNLQSNKWETHTDAMALSGIATSAAPHGIETVDETDTDVQKNKLVSNNQIKTLTDGYTTIPTVSNTSLLSGTSWTSGGGYDYAYITHSSSSTYPIVQVWDTDSDYLNDGAAIFDVLSVSAGMIEVRCFGGEKNALVKIIEEQ